MGHMYLKSQDAETVTLEGLVFEWDSQHAHARDDNFSLEGAVLSVGGRQLGKILKTSADDVGLWIELQLDRALAYARGLAERAAAGLLDVTASPALRSQAGAVKSWRVREMTFTTATTPRIVI